MNPIAELADSLKEIQAILKENPEILEFMRIAKDSKDFAGFKGKEGISMLFVPPYIPAGFAARLLSVSKARIYSYVKQNLLFAYYPPDCQQMRLKTSEVLRLPKRKENNNE